MWALQQLPRCICSEMLAAWEGLLSKHLRILRPSRLGQGTTV